MDLTRREGERLLDLLDAQLTVLEGRAGQAEAVLAAQQRLDRRDQHRSS
jgi:hypothetical protein